jgi:hypothetical protein
MLTFSQTMQKVHMSWHMGDDGKEVDSDLNSGFHFMCASSEPCALFYFHK